VLYWDLLDLYQLLYADIYCTVEMRDDSAFSAFYAVLKQLISML